MSTTIYSLNEVHMQVILPSEFKIKVVDKKKQSITEPNFVNAGYFTPLGDGTTYPVGNLIVDGKIVSDSAGSPSWINLSNKHLTTLIVYNDNRLEMKRVGDLSEVKDAKYAISGIPILRDGYAVKKDKVLEEGYFGSELYDTWHSFLGIRHDKLVVVGAKCNHTQMPYLMEVLGILDCIKLDGGGSFITKSGDFTQKTSENRRIHNIITW